MKTRLLILLVSLLFLLSCKKVVSCLEKTTGQATNELSVAPYNKIVLEGKVNLMLAYGENKTTLEADGSFIDDVVWSVENETLKVSYNPTCKTLKDREVVLNVSSKGIDYINHRGQGNIRSVNTLVYDKITFDPEDQYVNVDVVLDVDYVGVESGGLSSFRFTGKSKWIWIGNYGGDGYFDASELIVDKATISHNGTNLIELNVLESLEAKFSSSRDIVLHHTPQMVTEEKSNTGSIRYQ